MIESCHSKMTDSELNVTEAESIPISGWLIPQTVPTSNRWTAKPSSITDHEILINGRDDEPTTEPIERNPSSDDDVKQPSSIDGGSYNKTSVENVNASNSSVINFSSITIASDVDLLRIAAEKMMNQSAAGTDCPLQNDDNNQTNADDEVTATFAVVDDLDSVSLQLHDNFPLPETSRKLQTSRKKSLRSKYRKPSKTKDVIGATRTSRPVTSFAASSEPSMTSAADDDGVWMLIGERAPLQQASSADNVSATGYKSATLLSEEVATVSAAVASVLIFWSLLGTAICLVLRMRRRKRRHRHLKRHSLDDVTHIDMLDEMIRTELARGRARLNTSCSSTSASQSSPPTYANLPPPHPPHPPPLLPHFAGFQQTTTTFDSVQLVNSFNSISHNHHQHHQHQQHQHQHHQHGRRNVYEYFVHAGTGSGQFVAASGERHMHQHPPMQPTRSVYNSPNVERVSCNVRLSNARSFEVLQKNVRPKTRMDFHRSKSFNEKPAKAAALVQHHPTHETPTAAATRDSGRARVSGSPNKRSGVKEVGYVSLRDGPILAGGVGGGGGSRQQSDLSWIGFPPVKTSFDKTRTPEHPTESTVLNSHRGHGAHGGHGGHEGHEGHGGHGGGQYLPPYHVPSHHPAATSSVQQLYGGASRPYQDRVGQGGHPGHPWLGECRGGSNHPGGGTGDIRWRGYPPSSSSSSHHFHGCNRPMLYAPAGYCGSGGSRPVPRFPKMGQSCLVGELQRNASNPSSCSKSGGREAMEMLHCT